MSSSLRNTANSESIVNKNYLQKIYEKQEKIIKTLDDETKRVNSSIKTISNTLGKIGKSYAKLVALKHHYDLYGLYINDIMKTIVLCKEEHEKIRKEMTKLIQTRQTLYNATIMYIQDIEYVGLVKNSNISDVRALVVTLNKNFTKQKTISKLQSGVTTIGTKQNSTNRPINTIQNSLEFSNKNNNSRR
jgi:hypothetical protein